MGIITNNIIEKSLGSILSEVSGLLREVGMMGGQIAALIDEHGESHYRVFLNLVFNGLEGAVSLPTPQIYWLFWPATAISGGGSIKLLGILSTSETASTMKPVTRS